MRYRVKVRFYSNRLKHEFKVGEEVDEVPAEDEKHLFEALEDAIPESEEETPPEENKPAEKKGGRPRKDDLIKMVLERRLAKVEEIPNLSYDQLFSLAKDKE